MRRIDDGAHTRLLGVAPYATAVAVLALAGLLLTQDRHYAAVQRELEQTTRIQLALVRVHAELRAIESTQRGYALTGQADYAEIFRESVRRLREETEELRNLMGGDADGFAALADLARQRVQISVDIVNARRDAGADSAVAIVAGGRGRALMEAFTERAERVLAEHDALRERAQSTAARRRTYFVWTIVFGALICALVAWGTSWIQSRYAAARVRAAAELATANERLLEQTEELESQAVELEVQARELEEAVALHQEHQEWFRALVEHADDVVMVIDGGYRITYVSPAIRSILGYAPESLIGTHLQDLVHPDDFDRNVTRVETAGSAAVAREARYRHHDGTWRLLAGHASNLLDHPAVRGLVLNSRDVTDERRVAEQLRQAQKMEAVGLVTSGVAHDFNNILTSIQGHAQLALEDVRAPHRLQEDLDEILRASSTAAALTRHLLAFSRQQVMRPLPVNVNEVVGESARMLSRMVGTHVELETRFDEDVDPILADRTQIQQVLMNLVVNARDAMPDGGRIVIRTAAVSLTGDDAARLELDPGDYVRIAVSDSGFGMPEEVRARVFEPFFTTKPHGLGTGLGLSTCWGIVKQSGGHIDVQSTSGRGTTFTVHLPVAPAAVLAESQPPPRPPVPKQVHGPARRLLLVDDDLSVRRFTRRALETAGYSVLEAENGEAALRVLDDVAGAVDLVITDVLMPVMTGPVLARRAHERFPGVPFVFTSGQSQDHFVLEPPQTTGFTILEKPYTREQLVSAAADALTRRVSA